MKFPQISTVCLTLFAFATISLKADESGYTRLDKAALEAKRQNILGHQAARPVNVERGSEASAKRVPRKPLEASTILSAYGYWTFVPKGSVIHIPDSLKGNIASAPQGQLVLFPEFLAKNIAWLTTRELKMDEIVGDTPIKDDIRKAMATSGRIVVATLSGSPVTFKGQSN
ncbi:MAG: hypothetical protein ACSHX7_01210 [Luteolibacter sp.]